MKKILVLLAAMALSLFALAGPASATGGHGDDNKKVTFCHATGSETNPYVKITTSVQAFYNAGHINHADDIWEAFTYTTHGGGTVTVPAQGNTALLAFEDCAEPPADEVVAVPDGVTTDPCGVGNETFTVPPGRGYTVGERTGTYPNWSITVTANQGFTFPDKQKSATITTSAADFPNTTDCDIPATGGVSYDVAGGVAAGAAMVALALFLIRNNRRKIAE